MGMYAWAEERSRAMTMWDVGFLKITAMLFGIIVGAHVAHFVIDNIWWFAVPMLVLGFRSGYRWFTA